MKTNDCKDLILRPAVNGIIVEEAFGVNEMGRAVSNLDRHVFNNMDDLVGYLTTHFIMPIPLSAPSVTNANTDCDDPCCPDNAVWLENLPSGLGRIPKQYCEFHMPSGETEYTFSKI